MTSSSNPAGAIVRLLLLAQSGDLQARRDFLERVEPVVTAEAARQVNARRAQHIEVNDVAGEVLVGLARLAKAPNHVRFESDDALWRYVARAVWQRLQDSLRALYRPTRQRLETGQGGAVPSKAEEPIANVELKEHQELLGEHISNLAEEEREAVRLRLAGKTFQEIGELTSVTAKGARDRYNRGCRALLQRGMDQR